MDRRGSLDMAGLVLLFYRCAMGNRKDDYTILMAMASSPEKIAVLRAERWLITHVDRLGRARVLATIEAALKSYATSVCGSTWRTVRSCLARHQSILGHEKAARAIRILENPIEPAERKARPRRCKAVDEKTLEKIVSEARAAEDWELAAVLHVVAVTGCRPIELLSVSIRDIHAGWEITIKGAKTRHDRGLKERVLILEKGAGEHLDQAVAWVQRLDVKSLKALQERLAQLVYRLFPRRKARPSLYSFRHQLGAELKSTDKLSHQQVAAIMGHRSVQSVAVYGGRRRGSGRVGIIPSSKTVAQVTPGVRTSRPYGIQRSNDIGLGG